MSSELLTFSSQKTLNNGINMPIVGLGVWQTRDGKEVEQAVSTAISVGYRLIDTAAVYKNEAGVGRAVAASGIPREELFITTKLWNTDQGYDSVFRAFERSLQFLQMDYVDLYLIHWPFPGKRMESWRALEKIAGSGQCRAIGVSNYTTEHLTELMDRSAVVPTVNQVEFHPFLYQKELLEFCQKHSIQLEAYSPLAHGEKLQDRRIGVIAKKYDKTNAQIMLRWSLQHGTVVIPKSTNQDRIKENIDLFNFVLSEEDMGILDGLDENFRTCWDPTGI